jgi:hypothetical protein
MIGMAIEPKYVPQPLAPGVEIAFVPESGVHVLITETEQGADWVIFQMDGQGHGEKAEFQATGKAPSVDEAKAAAVEQIAQWMYEAMP